MKIGTKILLYISFGFLYVHRARGLLQPNSIYVAMRDFSNFNGTIRMTEAYEGFQLIPDWMQPGEAEFATQVSAFIRLETGEQFEADLTPMNAPEHHDPHPHGPVICEIRIGNDFLLRTEPFIEYHPTHMHHFELPCYPPGNHVYITLRGGPVYSGVLLAPHQLAKTHNRRRIESATLDVGSPLPAAEPQPQTFQPAQHAVQPAHQMAQPAYQMAQSAYQMAQPAHQMAGPTLHIAQPPSQRSQGSHSHLARDP